MIGELEVEKQTFLVALDSQQVKLFLCDNHAVLYC